MAGYTRVLVTHQVQFLPFADKIYVLHEGQVLLLSVSLRRFQLISFSQITHSGTYEQLRSQGVDFDTLMHKKFGNDDKPTCDEGKDEIVENHEGTSEDLEEISANKVNQEKALE